MDDYEVMYTRDNRPWACTKRVAEKSSSETLEAFFRSLVMSGGEWVIQINDTTDHGPRESAIIVNLSSAAARELADLIVGGYRRDGGPFWACFRESRAQSINPTPDGLIQQVEAFCSGTEGSLTLVIVQMGDSPVETIFFSPTALEIDPLLGAWGINTEWRGRRGRYKDLYSARLEAIYLE